MKAAVWTKYGAPERLAYGDVADPAPGPHDLIVRVAFTTVSAGDCEMRSLRLRFPLSLMLRVFFGLWRPKRVRVLGQEFAGVVDAVGEQVTRFAVGDRVFGETDFRMGAHAELLRVSLAPGSEAVVASVPEGVDLHTAVALPLGGREALKYLRAATVRPEESVLVVGAGGSIGTMAVQLARRAGARITAVDSAAKLEVLRRLGAAEVRDYRAPGALDGTFDVVFDIVGRTPRRVLERALAPGGRLIRSNPRFVEMLRGSRTLANGRRIITMTPSDPGDLDELARLASNGEVSPVVDPHAFSLESIVEAHRLVESGAKVGCLVVTVANDATPVP